MNLPSLTPQQHPPPTPSPFQSSESTRVSKTPPAQDHAYASTKNQPQSRPAPAQTATHTTHAEDPVRPRRDHKVASRPPSARRGLRRLAGDQCASRTCPVQLTRRGCLRLLLKRSGPGRLRLLRLRGGWFVGGLRCWIGGLSGGLLGL